MVELLSNKPSAPRFYRYDIRFVLEHVYKGICKFPQCLRLRSRSLLAVFTIHTGETPGKFCPASLHSRCTPHPNHAHTLLTDHDECALLLCTLVHGGAVLLLATVLWLLATVYLSLIHRKYAHIPRPEMSRYFFHV